MKQIIKYQSDDGTEFYDEDLCIEHELITDEINAWVSQLPEKPNLDGCAFENGAGYVQHAEEMFMRVRSELCEIANRLCPHPWFEQTIEKGLAAHSSNAGRIIGEIQNKALQKAWHRIECTDKMFREWGQPYFANHPQNAEQVCLNPQ